MYNTVKFYRANDLIHFCNEQKDRIEKDYFAGRITLNESEQMRKVVDALYDFIDNNAQEVTF